MSRVLIVEDEVVIRSELRRLLARAGHEVSEAGSVNEARAGSHLASCDLVLTDLRLPGAAGTELISLAAPTPVVVMTSYATIPSAVEAMRLGAADYIAKPFDHRELMLVVERWLQRADGELTAQEQDAVGAFPGLLGESPAMREVFARIRKVAPTDATVLIRGESGTGKELVARAIHEHGKRRGAALVAVNCAAVPEGLLESELFGHERGAFTGASASHTGLVEAASGGTLFLDEIGELPLNAQARLLRVLQEGEVRRVGATRTRHVDVRLIAATHRDLPAMVRRAEFREDLYHRLRVLEIFVPPLRARGEDIERLARHFLAQKASELGNPGRTLSQEACLALRTHTWPGNVRELHNAIERAAILSEDERIHPHLLAIEPSESEPQASGLRTPRAFDVHARGPARAHDLDAREQDIDLRRLARDPDVEEAADVTAHGVASGSAESAQLAGSAEPAGDLFCAPDDDTLQSYLRKFVLDHQDRLSETELARRLGISRKTLWERRLRLGIPRPRPTS